MHYNLPLQSPRPEAPRFTNRTQSATDLVPPLATAVISPIKHNQSFASTFARSNIYITCSLPFPMSPLQ